MLKLKDCFILRDIGNETVILSTDAALFGGIITVNPTGAFIVRLLKEGTTEETVIREMTEIYDVSVENARSDAEKIIHTLRDVGALTDENR